ncbi:MAG: RNA pyrophosphohydrolase [Pseudomonadota bacterium]
MAFDGQYFRAGVGAVITDGKGLVLAFERADVANAWQLPQGGLEAGEEPLRAALREIREETGIPASALESIGEYPEPLAYELPPHLQSGKTGRGQVLYWFLFMLIDEDAIDLQGSREFKTWRWMSLRDLAERTVQFRRPGYQRLADYFHTSNNGSKGR